MRVSITMTSYWARWRLKSPASGLFAQTFIQVQIKGNIKAPLHWPFKRGIHRWPVNSPHRWPVTWKMFPFDVTIILYFPDTGSQQPVVLRCQISIYMQIGFFFVMMTSSNGNIFRVAGPLCGEFTGYRSIPLTKASDAELWCFLLSAPEQTVEYKIETLVTRDALALIIRRHWNVFWHQSRR